MKRTVICFLRGLLRDLFKHLTTCTRLSSKPSFTLSFPKAKNRSFVWLAQGGRPPGPEPGFEEFAVSGRKREAGVFCFQRLAKALSAQIQEKLKMRRLPPTGSLIFYNLR